MQQLDFSGYGSGQVDFQHLLDTTVQPELPALNEFINRVVTQFIAQDPAVKIIFMVIGLSDRNDSSDLDCDARRVSEREASRQRMQSCRDWIIQQVRQRALANGVDVSAVDRSWFTHVSIAAMTAYLSHPHPATEAQRQENRAVVVCFREYPLPAGEIGGAAFGEPVDETAWLTIT